MIAGWNDVFDALGSVMNVSIAETRIMIGYFWMIFNCLSSAAFVLYMRKRIKLTNFKDFDTVYYNNLLSIPLLLAPSLLLEDWSTKNLAINLYVYKKKDHVLATYTYPHTVLLNNVKLLFARWSFQVYLHLACLMLLLGVSVRRRPLLIQWLAPLINCLLQFPVLYFLGIRQPLAIYLLSLLVITYLAATNFSFFL